MTIIESRRLLLLLAVLPWVACAGGQGATAKRGPGALPVRVAAVQAQDVTYRVKALGSLEAEELVQVTAEVDGAVAAVDFHEGDRVTLDTVLVRIDPDRYRLEAERTEATYKKALADQHRAEADFSRREALAKEQLVAPEELNRSRQETERLTAETAAAKAAWDWALANKQRSSVKPSRAGIINTRAVDTGQFVRTGTVLATLVDVSRLRLRFKVSEGESLQAREGQAVAFRVAATGDRDFEARIYHVGEVADATSRQVEVMAWVKNPGTLKPGFFAEVTLATESKKGATVVPEGAVQASERGFVAYVVEEGKAKARSVQLGLKTDAGLVEVLSGLKVGEIVVVEGSDRLADGVAVQPAGEKVKSAEPDRAAGKGAKP